MTRSRTRSATIPAVARAGCRRSGIGGRRAEHVGSHAAIARAAAQEAGGPGPAADRLIFSAFNVDQAPIEITQDKMDLYLYGLKAAGAEELAGAEDVRVIQAPASTLSLILNPAPAREGELNPFAIREIRQAVQYLVDRDFIAGDIYGGRAVPMVSHVSPLDYDELTVFETVRRSGIRYDPEFANALIAEQMEAAGATMRSGDLDLRRPAGDAQDHRPRRGRAARRRRSLPRGAGGRRVPGAADLPAVRPGHARRLRQRSADLPVARLHRRLEPHRARSLRLRHDQPDVRAVARQHARLAARPDSGSTRTRSWTASVSSSIAASSAARTSATSSIAR